MAILCHSRSSSLANMITVCSHWHFTSFVDILLLTCAFYRIYIYIFSDINIPSLLAFQVHSSWSFLQNPEVFFVVFLFFLHPFTYLEAVIIAFLSNADCTGLSARDLYSLVLSQSILVLSWFLLCSQDFVLSVTCANDQNTCFVEFAHDLCNAHI